MSDKKTDVLDALFGVPDYSGIAKNCTVKIDMTADESAAVLYAYDRGIDALDPDARHHLDLVMAKLKDQIWR